MKIVSLCLLFVLYCVASTYGESLPDNGRAQQPLPATAAVAHKNPCRKVFLTFDGAPNESLQPMMDLLLKNSVPATFFLVIKGPEDAAVASSVRAQGFQVGNHTKDHLWLPQNSKEVQYEQLAYPADLLKTDQDALLFRPPYGEFDQQTTLIARDLGMPIVMWDVDSQDWALEKHPEKIVKNIMRSVRGGSIVLLHLRAWTLTVLPVIIDRIREAGYEFGQLPQSALLRDRDRNAVYNASESCGEQPQEGGPPPLLGSQ